LEIVNILIQLSTNNEQGKDYEIKDCKRISKWL